MYKSLATVIIFMGCYLMTFPAFSDEWHFGVKLAYFETDLTDADDPDNAGIVVGYDWVNDYGSLGIEGDISSTFEEGRYAGEEVDVDTAGLFATYRTKGFAVDTLGFYLKLKGGVTYYELGVGATDTDETEASFGIGGGVNMGAVAFELEIVTINDSEMINFAMLF
jgi:outer membrane immunogenic protein